ncbi:hypothetical protein LJB89_02760 [Tyzzerella sp. OttesenSCG-928-J15]|nr:hypothetical protein [Tyzzerella sp. OttesenSCG-928-J15]
MTKQELRNYRDLVIKKRQVERKIEELQSMAYSIKSPQYDGMPKVHGTGNPTQDNATDLALAYSYMLVLRDKTLTAMRTIEDAIKNLSTKESNVLRAYYIEGLTWEQVCIEVGYEWAQVHRIHARALRKMI